MPKKWLSQKTCDVCGSWVVDKGTRCYDAVTKMGPWAFMCCDCYRVHGKALGQEYDTKTFNKTRDL